MINFNVKIFKYISFGISIFYGVAIVLFYNEILFYHITVGRIFIFTLVLYNAVLVIFNYYQNMHIRTVNKLETLKQNRSYQGKYWKDYYENYAAIRKTKHDMLNGYIGLYGLVKEERYDELKLYLESSIKNLKEMESVHYFGNPLIDAIVSKKISDAKERGIEVVFHCGVISIGDIDEEDLGILLANALDNAIESTVKSSYDKIDVYVSTMNCFLKIDVINYVDDITGVSFKNTSKVFDKENHGIGIKSMKDTAKKYNGSLQYDKKDNEVILSVIMNIN
ncbi:MAG: GHKL domain-containing protein [Bacilli bacterium]|nr:GHKL domain-containing protein [Bacilli bacterium]